MFFIALILSSCNKEQEPCNCGSVLTRDSVNFSVNLENNCSDNVKVVFLKKTEFDTLKNNLCLYGDFGGYIVW